MLDELPLPSQIGATRSGGIDLNKPRSRAVLAAALALAVAPGGFTGKPGRTRRYFISPAAARIISALLTLREHVIAPLLVDVADPRTPRHWTDINPHYQVLRLEMMALFAHIGIACG